MHCCFKDGTQPLSHGSICMPFRLPEYIASVLEPAFMSENSRPRFDAVTKTSMVLAKDINTSGSQSQVINKI